MLVVAGRAKFGVHLPEKRIVFLPFSYVLSSCSGHWSQCAGSFLDVEFVSTVLCFLRLLAGAACICCVPSVSWSVPLFFLLKLWREAGARVEQSWI